MLLKKRSWKFRLFFIALLLVGWVIYTLLSTGFFRKVDMVYDGEIIKEYAITGAEDIEIGIDHNLLFISSTDRAALRDGARNVGNLFIMHADSLNRPPKKLTHDLKTDFNPHGISVVSTGIGGYFIFVVNHVGDVHSIEKFEYNNDKLTHVQSYTDESMVSPNDVVAIDDSHFYFTNDHGEPGKWNRFKEEYLGDGNANVVYFNGSDYTEVSKGHQYANGITIDKDRNLLYMANSRNFSVSVFSIDANGDLNFEDKIKCKTGVDNIIVDRQGKLWIGSHPNLLRFQSYAAGKREIAPSEIVRVDYRSPGDYEVDIVFLDNGETISGTSIAFPFKDYVFVGSVMDYKLLVIENPVAD